MDMTNEFGVPVSIDDAWGLLTDLVAFVGCFPAVELREIEYGQQLVTVRVRVGQSSASYKGSVDLVEVDESARRVVMRIEGTEARGDGQISVTVTASLSAAADAGTQVRLATAIDLTGRVAGAGEEALSEALGKIAAKLSAGVEAALSTAPGAEPDAPAVPAAPEATTARSQPEPVESRFDAPVEPARSEGHSLGRRVLPYASIAGAIFLLRIVVYALRRRKK